MSDLERIAGIHAVEAALREGAAVLRLLVDHQRKDRRLQSIADLARARNVDVEWATREQLEALSGGVRHQGVVAELRGRRPLSEGDLESLLTTIDHPPFLLVLDGVQDPHNLGACLRSADAAGVDAVIAPRDRACGLTPVARKVAAGAAEHLPFIQVTNLARTLKLLQQTGVWLVGLAGEADADLYQAKLTGPLAIVMGAEEKGLRRLTRDACDSLARIPMAGRVESLNVSVATGITLFEALRQRRQ